jgi:hypothetical protein
VARAALWYLLTPSRVLLWSISCRHSQNDSVLRF